MGVPFSFPSCKDSGTTVFEPMNKLSSASGDCKLLASRLDIQDNELTLICGMNNLRKVPVKDINDTKLFLFIL